MSIVQKRVKTIRLQMQTNDNFLVRVQLLLKPERNQAQLQQPALSAIICTIGSWELKKESGYQWLLDLTAATEFLKI